MYNIASYFCGFIPWFPKDLINYRFLATETNLKALYIFRCFFTTSSVKLFVVKDNWNNHRWVFNFYTGFPQFFPRPKKPMFAK